MNARKSASLLILFLTISFSAFGLWYLNQGYGKVSALTYEYSKALYSACLSRNETHLTKVEEMLSQDDINAIPSNERAWIEAIIADARNGQWTTAANQARRMMEDQVQ